MRKRILLIEDEPGLQLTLDDRLTTEGYEVTIRGDGIKGEEEALGGTHDLILLDVMLPGRDGFGVCKNLRDKGLAVPILMLTARNTDLDTIMGLRQGADDYLAKPFDMGVLLARMEALLRRADRPSQGSASAETAMVEPQIRFGEFLLDRDRGALFHEDKEVALNAQEFRLLDYLVTHPDRVVSRDTLLDEVWGYDTETTSRTVDVHVAKLRQKLEESDFPRHILTVRGRGYKFTL